MYLVATVGELKYFGVQAINLAGSFGHSGQFQKGCKKSHPQGEGEE